MISNELTLFECTSTNHECTKAAFIMYTTGGGRGEGEDIFNGKGGSSGQEAGLSKNSV